MFYTFVHSFNMRLKTTFSSFSLFTLMTWIYFTLMYSFSMNCHCGLCRKLKITFMTRSYHENFPMWVARFPLSENSESHCNINMILHGSLITKAFIIIGECISYFLMSNLGMYTQITLPPISAITKIAIKHYVYYYGQRFCEQKWHFYENLLWVI